METFDFPYHRQRTEYPQSGNRIQLGNGYVFTSPPNAPDIRTFTLSFPTMFYYVNETDNALDKIKNPKYNMAVLEDFYNRHKLHKPFVYPHPVYGNIEVRFMDPLKIPEGIVNGNGALEDFNITLIESKQ